MFALCSANSNTPFASITLLYPDSLPSRRVNQNQPVMRKNSARIRARQESRSTAGKRQIVSRKVDLPEVREYDARPFSLAEP